MNWTDWPLSRWLLQSVVPRGHIDALTAKRVAGWALGHGPLVVEAWIGDRCVARGTPDIPRPDVAHAYPGRRGAGRCGFTLDLPAGAVGLNELGELQIIARPAQRWLPAMILGSFFIAGEGLERILDMPPDSGIVGPFPKPVIDAIAAVWPKDCTDLGSDAGQRRFTARLAQIMATPGLNALPVFAEYARYLATTLAHCRFVERHFPVINRNAVAGAADFHCKPNSVPEIFAIIHQLYVLKSWGVTGDFAEFGCFKGYSSAMLSFACAQLGLTMHVFDSFEGLPLAAGTNYGAGQYAGGLEEVRDHIQRFGVMDGVCFHKGFFADTFRNWRPPRIMCLWMDVDLELSARDLMVAADALDPRAGLFSHECTAGIFQDGDIVTSSSPDNPIPPLLERYAQMGRPLTGRYIAGYTGAFWPRGTGIPVLANNVLMHFAHALDQSGPHARQGRLAWTRPWSRR